MQGDLPKAVMVVVMVVTIVFSMAIQAVICWLLHQILSRIPREHRKQEPPLVWLLMIPFFSALWGFLVYPRISESFDSYFRSKGRQEKTGAGLAWAYCVAVLLMAPVSIHQIMTNPIWRGEAPPPGLDPVALGSSCYSFVVLILWVILIIRFWGLRGKVEEAPG